MSVVHHVQVGETMKRTDFGFKMSKVEDKHTHAVLSFVMHMFEHYSCVIKSHMKSIDAY